MAKLLTRSVPPQARFAAGRGLWLDQRGLPLVLPPDPALQNVAAGAGPASAPRETVRLGKPRSRFYLAE